MMPEVKGQYGKYADNSSSKTPGYNLDLYLPQIQFKGYIYV